MTESFSPVDLTAEIINSITQASQNPSKKINTILIVILLVCISILLFIAYLNERKQGQKKVVNKI